MLMWLNKWVQDKGGLVKLKIEIENYHWNSYLISYLRYFYSFKISDSIFIFHQKYQVEKKQISSHNETGCVKCSWMTYFHHFSSIQIFHYLFLKPHQPMEKDDFSWHCNKFHDTLFFNTLSINSQLNTNMHELPRL